MVAITGFGREQIFKAVRGMYTDVAERPEAGFHFPTGRGICAYLGYPAELLDAVPPAALESFAGVGYPHRCNVIRPGDVVLDIGAGAGTDALIAAHLTGATGRVYGLDMTPAMQAKLAANLRVAAVTNVVPITGVADQIPLADASVDVITSNGVLNLVPDKRAVFAEMARVLRPGGRFQIADIVIRNSGDALEKLRSDPQLWAECIVGALYQESYFSGLRDAGFGAVQLHCRQDYFARSGNEATRRVTRHFGAESITFSGALA